MSLSKKQLEQLDCRHATALTLLMSGKRAATLHRHTVSSLIRRGFLTVNQHLSYEGFEWLMAYKGPLEPVEYVQIHTKRRA